MRQLMQPTSQYFLVVLPSSTDIHPTHCRLSNGIRRIICFGQAVMQMPQPRHLTVIDRRHAVTHGYRVKGAVLRAGAEPDAAVRAELISSAELGCGYAVLLTLVDISLFLCASVGSRA